MTEKFSTFWKLWKANISYFVAPRPPVILSTEVQPTNYHYGDNVELICRVESNPPSDQLGWNMMVLKYYIMKI